MGTLKAQGTELYVIDPTTKLILAVACVQSIDGIGEAWDSIETTCLEDLVRSYEPSLRTPGTMTFGISLDTSSTVHARLHEIYEDADLNVNLEFCVGMSDGTAQPTLDSNDDYVLDTSRSWLTFLGFLVDYPFSFSQASLVQPQIPVQISGGKTYTRKTT